MKKKKKRLKVGRVVTRLLGQFTTLVVNVKKVVFSTPPKFVSGGVCGYLTFGAVHDLGSESERVKSGVHDLARLGHKFCQFLVFLNFKVSTEFCVLALLEGVVVYLESSPSGIDHQRRPSAIKARVKRAIPDSCNFNRYQCRAQSMYRMDLFAVLIWNFEWEHGKAGNRIVRQGRHNIEVGIAGLGVATLFCQYPPSRNVVSVIYITNSSFVISWIVSATTISSPEISWTEIGLAMMIVCGCYLVCDCVYVLAVVRICVVTM
eukprot:g62720.t1